MTYRVLIHTDGRAGLPRLAKIEITGVDLADVEQARTWGKTVGKMITGLDDLSVGVEYERKAR